MENTPKNIKEDLHSVHSPQNLSHSPSRIPTSPPKMPESQYDETQKQQQMPQQPEHRKRMNVVAMIGLGLILLSICLFMVSPGISIYSWFFGMIFSIAGLFFKPRWMAIIGTIISSIPILLFLLLVLVIHNPGPPTERDLEKMSKVLVDEVVDTIDNTSDEALLLEPVDVEDIVNTDSIP